MTLPSSRSTPRSTKLAELTADNPAQQDRTAALRNLANRKLQELSETIALYKSGRLDEVRALVLSNAGLLTMDQIRMTFAAMQSEETSLSAARSALAIGKACTSRYFASTPPACWLPSA